MARAGQKTSGTEKLKRSSASTNRPTSISGNSEGPVNLNRWSQSTPSSGGFSSTTRQRRNTFTRRLSGSSGGLGSHNHIQLSPSSQDFTKKAAVRSVDSPLESMAMSTGTTSSQRPASRPSATSTLAALSYAADSALTPNSATVDATPTNLSVSGVTESESGDYFGRSWGNSTPPRRPKISMRSPSSPYSPQAAKLRIQPGAKNSFANGAQARIQTPQTFSGPTIPSRESSDPSLRKPQELETDGLQTKDIRLAKEENLASTHDRGEKLRRKTTPSQKMMLSQALQKANDAVVLDNAQKFEGAMEAYGDACDLLQQVMLRSSGDEEKRKLDAIVSF